MYRPLPFAKEWADSAHPHRSRSCLPSLTVLPAFVDSMRLIQSRYQALIASALLGIALILLLRRYGGIDHDAALYLGQALRVRAPGIFDQDLFFLHGSQGNYTLFPWLLAQSFDWFAPSDVFLWGTLAGLLCFAAAAWYCLRALLPESQRVWAWIGVLCLPPVYGRIFRYGESFLTPRLFAEALCLLGIGLLVRGRWLPALACAALAGLLHPLQAIGAMMVAWAWLVLRDRRWLHVAWLAVPIAVLGVSGIEPFDRLFHRIDPAWLAQLNETSGQLFVTGWAMLDYIVMGFDVFVLAHAWRTLRGPFGAWCAAALAGLALGVASSLALVDALHLQLPAGLQLWRVHWLAHWLAMAAVAALLFRDIRAGEIPRALCLGLAALLAWKVGWIWVPLALLYACWPQFSARVQPRLQSLLGGLFAIGMLMLLAHYVATELLEFRQAQQRLDMYPLDHRLLMFPLVALGIPLLGLHLWNRLSANRRWLLIAGVLCPLVALGSMRWNDRPAVPLAMEANAFRPDIFGTPIPEDAQVFWDSVSVIGPWLVLHRADYFSPQQLSGVVFNRDTASDGFRRSARTNSLTMEGWNCRRLARSVEEIQRCRISNINIQRACAPHPAPRPDYLVLPYRLSQRALGQWTITDPATGEAAASYWLYDCRDVQG